jgi:hypothetical protein
MNNMKLIILITIFIFSCSKQSSDKQSSDKQSSDKQSSDKQSSDKQSSDKQSSDKQSSDKQSSDKQKILQNTNFYLDISSSMNGFQKSKNTPRLENFLESLISKHKKIIKNNDSIVKYYTVGSQVKEINDEIAWIKPNFTGSKSTEIKSVFEEVIKNESNIYFLITDGIPSATDDRTNICTGQPDITKLTNYLYELTNKNFGIWLYSEELSFNGKFYFNCGSMSDETTDRVSKALSSPIQCPRGRECHADYNGPRAITMFVFSNEENVNLVDSMMHNFAQRQTTSRLVRLWPPLTRETSTTSRVLIRKFNSPGTTEEKNSTSYQLNCFQEKTIIQGEIKITYTTENLNNYLFFNESYFSEDKEPDFQKTSKWFDDLEVPPRFNFESYSSCKQAFQELEHHSSEWSLNEKIKNCEESTCYRWVTTCNCLFFRSEKKEKNHFIKIKNKYRCNESINKKYFNNDELYIYTSPQYPPGFNELFYDFCKNKELKNIKNEPKNYNYNFTVFNKEGDR